MIEKFLHRLACIAAVTLLAGCATPGSDGGSGRHLVLSDDGQSEIMVSASWQTRPNFSVNADIRLSDSMNDNYLLVNTYSSAENRAMPLAQLAQRLNGALLENSDNGKLSAPRSVQIGGRAAIEQELRATIGDTQIIYLTAVVDGIRVRHHLVGWLVAGQDMSVLRQAMSSFRESAVLREPLERVNLVFKWPSKLSSQATFQFKSNKRGEQFEMQGESAMSVKPAGDQEHLISTRVTRHKITGGKQETDKDKEKNIFVQNVLQAALTEVPDYVVNGDGEFVRIENLPAYHRRVQAAMVKGLPKGNSEALTKARDMVQSLFTQESLAVSMQDDWNNSVGSWAGGSYALGLSYEYTMPYQAPALGEQAFPMTMTQQLTGFVPCQKGAAPRSCVRLLQTSRVSGADYTRAMDVFVRKTVGNDVSVTNMEIVTTVELVTDPRTMLPYASSKKETKRITISAGGQSSVSADVQESSTVYQY